jgi:hypothetical protein
LSGNINITIYVFAFSGVSSLSRENNPPKQQQQRYRHQRRSQSGILEKKSVFTRAYDDVAVARPNSAEVLMDE